MSSGYVLGNNMGDRSSNYVFDEEFLNEFDAFAKYYKNICANGFISNIYEEINNMEDFCDLFSGVESFGTCRQTNFVFEPYPENENKNMLFASKYVKLDMDTEKGRMLIVTKNIPSNTILIKEVPTVLQVAPVCACTGDRFTSLYRCHHCGSICRKFYTCDGCNVCIFCSRDCLTNAYKFYHPYECYGFQRHFWPMENTDYSYISFRMLLYGASKNFDTDFKDYTYGNLENNYPFIYGLETNYKEKSKYTMNKILYSSVRNLLYLRNKTSFFTPHASKPNYEDLYFYMGGLLVKHYCQAQTNNVLLNFPNPFANSGLNTSSGSGKAICPTIALINHACTPNATALFCSNSIIVKSIVPIRKGEEITLCYAEVNAFFGLAERRLITEEFFHFTCKCSLCLSQERSIEAPYKCPICNLGNAKQLEASSKPIGICLRCFKTFPFDPITKVLKRAAKYKSTYMTHYRIEPLISLTECYKEIYLSNSAPLLDLYRLIYEKYLLWGEMPLQTLKYGLLLFHLLEMEIPTLYKPFLSAKLMFMKKMVDTEQLIKCKATTSEDLSDVASQKNVIQMSIDEETGKILNIPRSLIAKQFVHEVVKVKKDLLVFLPEENLEYYVYIVSKVHTFFRGIRSTEILKK